jgi:hypothetical protein
MTYGLIDKKYRKLCEPIRFYIHNSVNPSCTLSNRGGGRKLIPPPFERSTRRRGGNRAIEKRELKFITHGPPLIMSHAIEVKSKKYSTSPESSINPIDTRGLDNYLV